MKVYLLERTQTIPCSLDETFDFFSDAFNLERITPPFLRFRILTPPPIRMAAGTRIEYRLALFGVPVRWETLIEQWKPPDSFIDSQRKGPYARWRHTHSFEAVGTHETLVRDRVEYGLPYGLLGKVAHALFIQRWLTMIFDYRALMTARLLGAANNVEGQLERP